MPKPKPEQFVFEQDPANPLVTQETFEKCYERMQQNKEDRGGFGFLRSHEIRGQSQRLFQNQSPTSKARENWVDQLVMSTGKSSSISIKV
jgi:hypothetical protein